MAPTVQRSKTAFQFFQSGRIGDIKRELGAGTSMGTAMTELSQRWKAMSQENREPFVALEAQDRARFEKDSRAADAQAIAEQNHRRKNLVAQDGEDASFRGARARIAMERAEDDEKKRKSRERRLEEMDPEEIAERRRVKAQKKAEALARQQEREAKEQAVADQHRKLEKSQAVKADKRLDYLLKQSSIFAKLKMGHDHEPEKKEEEEKAKAHHRGKNAEVATEEDEELDDDEAEPVFLTKQPSTIKFGTMKPYQLEGLNWMIHLGSKGLNGILADEMGLGKTLQSISILAYNWEFLNNQGPHLICVPKSTLSNWMNELARWCPSLRAIRFHGNKDERTELVEEYFTNEAAAHDGRRPDKQVMNEKTGEMEDDNSNNPRSWDVCVTTYEVCNTEKRVLSKFAWKYLVIDEAHRLKNETSMFSKTVRLFHTSHRLLLTGTPLQNNLHELWALLNFLLPDIFSSSEQFDQWFDLEVEDEEAKKNMISQLHKILRPFMLRRLKADVAKGLPPKTETLIMVGMSSVQKKLYKSLLLRDIDSITSNTNKAKTAVLNIVMQLRKCCGHPYLFEGVEDRTLDPLGEHLVENCGKLNMVDKLLKKLQERGSRVLIFTQMTRVLDILEDYLVMRGYQYCRIDGNTAYEDRESAIDNFNKEGSEKFVFILSTRAGGLGINLQTADTVILYDSDWNPQADLQAQDRCHRLGQKKPVNIYRLVSENTVEEKIVERAQQKLKLDAMVVQQGRLKDKDTKVTKEEIMAAVRFGADTVFRSEESTITDDDIDVILERGKARTKELAEKLQKAEKGDLLDFRLDGGISAQTFEGIDYSDKDLRDQLRMLAADSIGKRERKAPPTNYNPIIQPKKTMVVNNRKIKLPRELRLPRMEDHQFYNRERLIALGKFEFQTYASLKQLGQLPSREIINKRRTLLPDDLGQEKLDLLAEGFGNWTRSQYFHFVKAAAKFGRDDLVNIAIDMELPVDAVTSYSQAFWKYAPTELKKDEWDRVISNVEKGEQKISKKRMLSSLLTKFVSTFDDPRNEMTFANKGTAHFCLEQDRALLCAVDKFGYGNWDNVREELRTTTLLFQHTVQGLNCDAIAKRCDYRMRQMERECDARSKKMKSEKPAAVIAATNAIQAIKDMEIWEGEASKAELQGENLPPLTVLSDEAQECMKEIISERESWIDRIHEIEIQVRGCKALAEETKRSIQNGAQYVNYSNITLKAGGPNFQVSSKKQGVGKFKDTEAKIKSEVLKVPACGECNNCTDIKGRKLCVKRLEVRKTLLESERKEMKIAAAEAAELSGCNGEKQKANAGYKKRKREESTNGASTSTTTTIKKVIDTKIRKPKAPGSGFNGRITSLGNKRMSVPDELVPQFCRRIGAKGTNKRMDVITQFALDYPDTSLRQATFKFSELTTKFLPDCIPAPDKKGGRAFMFYLRPKYYHLLPADERPNDWEVCARKDELVYENEKNDLEQYKEIKKDKIKNIMSDDGVASSQVSIAESNDMSMDVTTSINGSPANASNAKSYMDEDSSDDETEDDEPMKKRFKY